MNHGAQLLNDSLLDGTYSVQRLLGPPRIALAVDRGNLADVTEAIGLLCLTWGGAADVLIPAERGTDRLDPLWRAHLDSGTIDHFCTRSLVRGNDDIAGTAVHDYVKNISLFSAIHGADRERGDWPTVLTALPPEENPWYLAYLACLGTWPEQIPQGDLSSAGFREGLTPDHFIPVQPGVIEEPGAVDLVDRLRDTRLHPARASQLELGVTLGPRNSGIGENRTLPFKGWERAQYGPNFIVVYTPGDVEDLALLWNFRAGLGAQPYAPLGVPESEAVETLKTWSDVDGGAFAMQLFGMGERPWGLISRSVGRERLTEIADELAGRWTVPDAPKLLPPGDRPGRPSTDVATFSEGQARVLAMAPDDRNLWRRVPGNHSLTVRINPDQAGLPPTKALMKWLPLLNGWRGGGYESDAAKVDDMVHVPWPSGWTVLRAHFADLGLEIRPSRPGQAAMSLLEATDDIAGLEPLAHAGILSEAQRLSEPSGRPWFEEKVREIGRSIGEKEGADAKWAEIDQHLSELIVPGDADEPHELSRDSLRARAKLTNELTDYWIEWAEAHELLVRGTHVACVNCDAKHWRSVNELAPPITCPGCGRMISRPYRPDQINFRYRAGERLRQTVSRNALPHVLAARWHINLLRSHGLYGIHPGFEVLEDNRIVGEIDLALLFRSGELAIGECKRTPEGLHRADIEKHEALADRLQAAWTFYSVPAWLQDCSEIWTTLGRALPGRPRFVITYEQLLQPLDGLFWQLGTNPFIAEPATPDEQAGLAEKFADNLGRIRADPGGDPTARLLEGYKRTSALLAAGRP